MAVLECCVVRVSQFTTGCPDPTNLSAGPANEIAALDDLPVVGEGADELVILATVSTRDVVGKAVPYR
jgi:hypothetical protein